MHRRAFLSALAAAVLPAAFASRLIPRKPPGRALAPTAALDAGTQISLRMIRAWDPSLGAFVTRIDALYGWHALPLPAGIEAGAVQHFSMRPGDWKGVAFADDLRGVEIQAVEQIEPWPPQRFLEQVVNADGPSTELLTRTPRIAGWTYSRARPRPPFIPLRSLAG